MDLPDRTSIINLGSVFIRVRGKKISSTKVDLSKDTIIDEVSEEVLDVYSR